MKVKAYELMIFNFVYESGEILLLDKWEFKQHIIDDVCKNIVPIPLTEGWLKDFGFKIAKMNYYELKLKDENILAVDYKDGEVWLSDKVDKTDIRLTQLDHVHQLQNLYFALTNEELKQ